MPYKILKIVIITSLIFTFTGCTEAASTTEDQEEKIGDSFTMDEISKHNSENNCWLLIENKVYDVSEFVSSHPGGKAIFEGCGGDATVLFGSRPMGSGTDHSPNANGLLKNHYIGNFNK